jgi:citrate lyase subunit beta/citryl-CoA lyase
MTSDSHRSRDAVPDLPVTYLFVPAIARTGFDKAVASGAGAVIVDLEDARGTCRQGGITIGIRIVVRQAGRGRGPDLLRINDRRTPWHDADMALVAQAEVRGVLLPKAESVEADRASRIGVGARAVSSSRSWKRRRASSTLMLWPAPARVQRICSFGNLDYVLDLDLSGDERGLLYPAARIVVASRAAGIAPPIAGVTPEIGDNGQGARRSHVRACLRLRREALHPPRPDRADPRSERPSESEVAWANAGSGSRRSKRGRGRSWSSKMVDRPVIEKALRILARS